MKIDEFKYVEVEECHGKFRLCLKGSSLYITSFNDEYDAVNAANVIDRALEAKRNDHIVEPIN